MRLLVPVLLLAAVVAAAMATARARAETGRPQHVVLISVDGCRADHLGCGGYARPTSPNLDRLAREGALFSRNYAQANESLMSHASLLSGRYAGEIAPLSYASFAMPDDLATLPRILKANGFATAAFTGGGHVSHRYGFSSGFDVYDDPNEFGSFFTTVPRALEWLEGHRDQQTFTFLHGYDCHRPYIKPAVFGHLYDAAYRGDADRYLSSPATLDRILDGVYYPDFELKMTPTWAGDRPIDPDNYAELARQAPHLRGTRLSEGDVRHLIAHYDGAVTYADTWLGVFFAGLADLGLDASNTLVVVVADHGEDLMEHGVFNHRAGLQTANIHVPLVFWGAGVRVRGQRLQQVTENVDVLPTVLAAVGVAPPAALRGRDLGPLLQGREADGPTDRVAFSEGILAMAALTGARHQLLALGASSGTPAMLEVVAGRAGRLELYDLQADPGERRDLAPAGGAALASLRSRLQGLEQMEVAARPAAQLVPVDPKLQRELRRHGYPAP